MGKSRSKNRRCLTDDLLVEILSRLPIKSICRFKCVSTGWRDLISHPDHQRKLPQTLAGILYQGPDAVRFHRLSDTGRPASFDFLPMRQDDVAFLDCCNGLFLCRCWSAQDGFRYLVCNPATEKWATVPDSGQADKMCLARLGFDPAVSSHFHVFEFLEDTEVAIAGVQVYSSSTGGWVHKDDRWTDHVTLVARWSPTVFLNGCLHFITFAPDVTVVDTEGKTCRKMRVPDGRPFGFLHQSRGCLHYANFVSDYEGDSVVRVRLVIYALEDYESQEWTLKHSAEVTGIFGRRQVNSMDFSWVAVHPEHNFIFFTVRCDHTLISYDMDRQLFSVIGELGHESVPPFLPYVARYTEIEALHISSGCSSM